MQRSRVKVNDQGRRITLRELERRCQLVVRLKVNKYYQELLCSLSSYINLLNSLNFQGLRNRLLAPGRFQTSSPWSRSLTNSKPLAVLVLVLVFGQSFLGKVCRDPTALRWVARFVAIRLRLDESLNLGQWFSVVWLCESSCPLAPWTASGPRQNLSTNRLRTHIWSSPRITLDHLATTRSSTLGKLLAPRLGNWRPPLHRVAMVGWSWCWCLKSHVGYVQATFFSHRYNGSSGGFVERELQLLLHQHRNRKGIDLQIVS